MNDKRLPKPGEVWTHKHGHAVEIVSGYPDAVVYRIDGETCALTLDDFLDYYQPPEPTVLGSRWLIPDTGDGTYFATWRRPHDEATHRLDLMSDGEFRVVKL